MKTGIAGLTGGIASGKSTVSKMLEAAGAKIIDADIIARQVVKKGSPAWEKIILCFGNGVLGNDGEINRAFLGNIIFNDEGKKKQLNAIVHPYVMEKTDGLIRRIRRENPDSVIVLDVPLLMETGMDRGLSDVIVVWVPEKIQLERLMKRDHLSETDARSRIASQMSIEEKRRKATMVIDNSGNLKWTRDQALSILTKLKSRLNTSP